MDDILLLIASTLLSHAPCPTSLLAFVKLQATHRSVWLRYRHDKPLWEKLLLTLPKWSLPPHMGLRRRVITGIKLLSGKCLACDGPAPRVFMAFQARFCRRCCHKLLVSDHELAWRYGIVREPNAPFIVRFYKGVVRVRFYLRQHLHLKLKAPWQPPSREQAFVFNQRWGALRAVHVHELLVQMT